MPSDGATGLQFAETGIADVLKQRVLKVPLNQRSYAWGSGEVQTLFEDCYKAFDAGEKIYFLGAIVLTRSDSGVYQVADGQQRLATTSILIAAVRDYLIELGDDVGAATYQSQYLLDYDPRQKSHRPKLNLNYEDHEFFLTTILKAPKDRAEYQGRRFPSHDRLRVAADLAREYVRSITAPLPTAEKGERLYDWIDFVQESAKVIMIVVPAKVGSAFKMFETLNGRGMPASQLDILKNYLFDKGQHRLSDLHPRWISMFSRIEDLGEDDLLLTYIRHFWISRNGPTTERELGEKIEEAIKSERQAVDLVSALDVAAVDYVALLVPREDARWNDFARQTRDCIFTLTRELGVSQLRPLMLAVARTFTVKEAEKAFELFLSWSVRFLIVGGGGGGVLDRHYGLRAMEVTKKEITTAKKLAQAMEPYIPKDEEFKTAFSVATIRRANLARYYLRALELHVKGEQHPQFLPSEDTTAVNLEHVLPVTPDRHWEVEPDVAAAFYRRLGNMVLLNARDNVEIGNGSFDDKKPVLKNSPFELTSEVGRSRKWGPTEIERRQVKLAELAPLVWPI